MWEGNHRSDGMFFVVCFLYRILYSCLKGTDDTNHPETAEKQNRRTDLLYTFRKSTSQKHSMSQVNMHAAYTIHKSKMDLYYTVA